MFVHLLDILGIDEVLHVHYNTSCTEGLWMHLYQTESNNVSCLLDIHMYLLYHQIKIYPYQTMFLLTEILHHPGTTNM